MGKETLTPQQNKFIEFFKNERDLNRSFYLTEGTALAAFYLNHRKSEDLDFFSEKEIDILSIESSIKKAKSLLEFIKFDLEQSFNRNLLFLHLKEEVVLKAEFTYFPLDLAKKLSGEIF